MSFLVVSHDHSLIPFAYRLKLQGHSTELVVCSPRYEKAWEGKFDHILPASEVSRKNLEPSLDLAKSGEVTVLSDNYKTSKMFAGVETFFGVTKVEEYDEPASIVRLGGWFDGESFQNPHLLVCDVGAWPGGFGPLKLGGLTLIRLDAENHSLFHEFIAPVRDLLREKYQFQGLVQAGLSEGPSGRPEIQGVSCGWPFLQAHAFLSELEQFSSLLAKEKVELSRKIVTVVPVSIPPWPSGARPGPSAESLEVGGLTPKQLSRVFWHDVQLDSVKRKVLSAGLDGLLGVTRGAADTPDLARSRSLAIALAIQVPPEKQMRPDAGSMVAQTVAEFEAKLGVVL